MVELIISQIADEKYPLLRSYFAFSRRRQGRKRKIDLSNETILVENSIDIMLLQHLKLERLIWLSQDAILAIYRTHAILHREGHVTKPPHLEFDN
jgi:hypothetical protein